MLVDRARHHADLLTGATYEELRARAEASDDWWADGTVSAAGDSAAHWLELVELAPVIPVLNKLTGEIKRRALFSVEMSEAISTRQKALRERVEELTR